MKWLAAILVLWCSTASAEEYANRSWDWQFSPGAPTLYKYKTGFYFSFPTYTGRLPCSSDQACASAHYLVTTPTRSLSGAQSITASGKIAIAGHPQLHWQTEPTNTGPGVPQAHFYMQRVGDDLSGNGKFEFYRWWSNPVAIQIKRGAYSATAPLYFGYWSSVRGRKNTPAARAGFQATLAHPAKIGMTFGAGCCYGHGLNVRGGRVTMTVARYTVNRAAAKAKARRG